MRAARISLATLGLAALVWGLWLVLQIDVDQLLSLAVWLGGGVLIHDGLIAPTVVLIGGGIALWLPRQVRAVVGFTAAVWASVSLAVFAALAQHGGWGWWLALSTMAWVACGLAYALSRWRLTR